jgi:hypothetical protein
MLYWLYDIPTLLAVALFAVVFVGVCWIGLFGSVRGSYLWCITSPA